MKIVDEHAPDVGIAPACRALEVSRATWYRRRNKDTASTGLDRRRPPRRLSEDERDHIVTVLCSDEFIDCSPRAVYATLLDRDQYLCSIRSMYRILAERQAVQWMLADAALEIHAARLVTYNAARLKAEGKPFQIESSMAKLIATESATRVMDSAIQIHGGMGLAKELPLERWYRELRTRRIGEGPSEIHRMVIARDLTY